MVDYRCNVLGVKNGQTRTLEYKKDKRDTS